MIRRKPLLRNNGGEGPDFWSLDAHCDSWYMRHFLRGEGLPPELQGVDVRTFSQVTLKRLSEGNVRCLLVNTGDIGLLTSSAIIDCLHAEADGPGSRMAICRNAREVSDVVRSGRLALVLACESSFLFLGRVDLLRNWYRLGVRVMSVTHGEGQEGMGWFGNIALSQDSLVHGDSSCALQGSMSHDEYLDPELREELAKKEEGLTPFGKSAVEEMIRLGIVCDLSHANDATFWDILEIVEKEVSGRICCTHSNCAALCNHTRNLTDTMMEALADRGGVMGLCFFGGYIDRVAPSLEKYVDHVMHALDIMGPDHIGIGTDYDGVAPGDFMAIPHPGRMNELWSALTDAGISKADLRKIACENFLRLLEL